MIKKEVVNIKELNRKIHSTIQLKPNLNGFPEKEINISLRNTPGIMKMDLEIPSSFKNDNIVITQINEIKNNFRDTNLNDINLNDINLNDINLNNKNLNDTNLDNTNLDNTNLDNTNLNDINLNNTNLNDINLNNTNLNDTNLNNTNLNDTNLNNTNLNDTNLNDINLNNKNLNDINLNDINLNDTKNSENMLVKSIMDIKRNTTLNKGIIIIFLFIMSFLIYFGVHKNI